MTIRPIFPILGAIIGFLIAKSKEKSNATMLLYAIIGAVIAWGLAMAYVSYIINSMLNEAKNMTQAQADKTAASICQFEKDIEYFKSNNERTIDNPFGYDDKIKDYESRVANFRELLAMGEYSYTECKAVKNI